MDAVVTMTATTAVDSLPAVASTTPRSWSSRTALSVTAWTGPPFPRPRDGPAASAHMGLLGPGKGISTVDTARLQGLVVVPGYTAAGRIHRKMWTAAEACATGRHRRGGVRRRPCRALPPGVSRGGHAQLWLAVLITFARPYELATFWSRLTGWPISGV